MLIKQPKADLKHNDIGNEINSYEQQNFDDYMFEPVIQKILKQQEEINRFKDTCNPGISFGFYHYW